MQIETKVSVPTVSEMVRADYRVADVFKKWGINYCCGGNRSLAEVCQLQSLDAAAIEQELTAASQSVQLPNNLAYRDWPVNFLVDYIIHVHHVYLKQTIPSLANALSSFVNGHVKKYPYLPAVDEVFNNLKTEVQEYLQAQDESIFPYVRLVSNTFERREIYGSLFVRTLRKPLGEMVSKEHNRLNHLLLALRKQTKEYRFPEKACTNHQVLYHKLKEFDANVSQQIFLEGTVLFPKVLEMEKTLLHL